MAHPLTAFGAALGFVFACTPAFSTPDSDFDDNGCDDLPIVVAIEDIDTVIDAGALNIIYGRSSGLSAGGDQFLHRGTPGFAGALAENGLYAPDIATGDFDDDGRDDLAIGFSTDTVDTVFNAGSVAILYGADSGLRTQGDQRLHRNLAGVASAARDPALFGFALAVGDFDGDGVDDLAVGAPFDPVDGMPQAGSVHIFYGSPSGLTVNGDQVFSQNTAGVRGTATTSDFFGFALAAGDFDDDGRDDLAIGAYIDEESGSASGSVNVLYGSPGGLVVAGDQLWHQGVSGIAGDAVAGDRFGWELATGDFDNDGFDDLAVSVYLDTVDTHAGAGAVAVLYGSSAGLRANGDQLWHQNQPGVQDDAAAAERFGFTLAAGDFDDDGFDDLAIGVPHTTIDGHTVAGAVNILYGSSQGLRANNDQYLHQDVPGIQGATAANEYFGITLFVGDFDGDGHDDLAVAAPVESVDAVSAAGTVTIFYGSGGGISLSGEQVFSQDTAGIKDTAEPTDLFGLNGYFRLIIG